MRRKKILRLLPAERHCILGHRQTTLQQTTGAVTVASPGTSMVYTVTGTDAAGCTNAKSVSITVNAIPVVTVLPADTAICKGSSATLKASGASSYLWSPSNGLTTTHAANTTTTPDTTISYSVIGTTSGCSDTAVVVVTVKLHPFISAHASTVLLVREAQ